MENVIGMGTAALAAHVRRSRKLKCGIGRTRTRNEDGVGGAVAPNQGAPQRYGNWSEGRIANFHGDAMQRDRDSVRSSRKNFHKD